METESDGLDPQDHLRRLDAAATVARRDAHQRSPLWFWPTLALLAPAVVSFRSTTGSTRLALIAVFTAPVVIALVVVWRKGRGLRSRERPGIGPGSLWKFLGLWAYILGLQMSMSLLSVDEPIRTGVFTYLFIATLSTYAFWKFDDKQSHSTTLSGKVS